MGKWDKKATIVFWICMIFPLVSIFLDVSGFVKGTYGGTTPWWADVILSVMIIAGYALVYFKTKKAGAFIVWGAQFVYLILMIVRGSYIGGLIWLVCVVLVWIRYIKIQEAWQYMN